MYNEFRDLVDIVKCNSLGKINIEYILDFSHKVISINKATIDYILYPIAVN